MRPAVLETYESVAGEKMLPSGKACPCAPVGMYSLEVLARHISLIAEVAVDVDDQSRDDGESDTETEDDGVADALRDCPKRERATQP